MKKYVALLIAVLLVLSSTLCAAASGGNITYDGTAREFIFKPGTDYSPTDLFPDFKDVMPGDSLTQKITVKNDASYEVKVKIYIRSKGAHSESAEFLSQLRLRVKTSRNNNMAYMFDAAASETAQLTEWVCLGTLYSGGEVNLDVILDVPVEMGNDFQNQIGYLDWEFMVEELPVGPDDPEPPKTGDSFNGGVWVAIMCGSLLALIILFMFRRKERKQDTGSK